MKNIFTKEEVLALNSILKFVHELAVALCGEDQRRERDEIHQAALDVQHLCLKLGWVTWEEDNDEDDEDFDEEDEEDDEDDEDFDEEDEEDEEEDDDEFWDLMEG